jgi:hypothetical protein
MKDERDEERAIGLLVDGELSEVERRALVLDLDARPGAWRRCALSFLEAQAWREALRAPVAVEGGGEGTRREGPVSSRKRPWAFLPVSAAALVAGILLGLLLGDYQPPSPPRIHEETATRGPGEPRPVLPASERDIRLAGEVVLDVEDAGELDSVRVPIVEGVEPSAEWLSELPTVFTPAVCRSFERRGHIVEVSRVLVEVPLGDGQRVLLPVDEMRVAAGRERL